ncbi:MAG: hypothetical protein M1827_001227 [Pycnora praestabilis]|nr:MAG: hypothetical protein M1827_001227 [Pycnora praestabilis]
MTDDIPSHLDRVATSKEDRHHEPLTVVQDDSVNSGKSSTTPASTAGSPSDRSNGNTAQPTHQRFVLTDPVAFRYLEEDPLTTVLERRRRLEGYELYLVEQWACSRTHPTFIITTYTGDPTHSVLVGVLSVPTNEDSWSPRLRVYFKAVAQYHARRKETSLGILMVTNISSFPSALNVIAVPEGDVKKHREDFIVNENLKRLGCSGRAGLTVSTPSGATQAKFHQLYRTSDRIPLYSAVIELVKLCQVALMLFDKLAPEYADGLLCDVTEQGINDWWTEIGSEFYKFEPSDGILGPTTVAALLGMLMGARNRLNAFGAPVAKDVFDITSLKRGIGYFQKSQKMERTRRLDRQTLERLHKVTAKAASGEGWMMPKAVKSTVAELSGKGGEMVMGMVGAREKAGIAEVETMDIERFVQLVHGERSKWLWYGKPRKTSGGEILDISLNEHGKLFSKDDQGNYSWSSKKRNSLADDGSMRKRENESPRSPQAHESNFIIENGERDPHLKKTVLKSVTGRVNDARSGFGRIKDAVGIPGFRGHHHKHSKDDRALAEADGHIIKGFNQSGIEITQSSIQRARTSSPTSGQKLDDTLRGAPPPGTKPARAETDSRKSYPSKAKLYQESYSKAKLPVSSQNRKLDRAAKVTETDRDGRDSDADAPGGSVTKEPSLAGSVFENAVHRDMISENEHVDGGVGLLLRRTQSLTRLCSQQKEIRSGNWYPRHLSFSVAEEAIFVWDSISWSVGDDTESRSDPSKTLLREQMLADEAKRMRERLYQLESQIGSWVEEQIDGVEGIETQGSRDQAELDILYYQRYEDYNALNTGSNELLAEERSHLTEAIKDVEMLGAKLEYEINALQSKVEDVEDSVANFERQVVDIEARAQELEDEETAKESWALWTVRMLTGHGSALPAHS